VNTTEAGQGWQARRHGLGGVRAALGERLRHNLRARVALGLGLPILLTLSGLSLVHFWRERHLLADQAELTAAQLGQTIVAGLRHSMLVNDAEMVQAVLADFRARDSVERAQIVALDGQVLVDSGAARAGQVQQVAEPGCTTCHRVAAGNRPETAVVASDAALMRVAVPIDNEPGCAGCHQTADVHLGILMIDVPMRVLWPHAVRSLQMDLAISALITLLATAALYWLLHRLVVRRVEAFRRPLAAYALGNFDVRLPTGAAGDELDDLAEAFNRMANQIERHARAETARAELRHQAIIEERERIARELHDGLAQVLGYVQNKATAVRLLLRRQQTEAAEKHLGQLEEAARDVFVDVREAILGLRMTSQRNLRLSEQLGEYAAHFSRLSDLAVDVQVAPSAAELALPLETELQLLRIVQEALSNARKHARASVVRVAVSNGGPKLVLTVSDDGIGFEPERFEQERAHGRPHFGLGTMRERAEAIGADFQIESCPGRGTCISVLLPLQKGA
jgi:signal transduction histidine kinase